MTFLQALYGTQYRDLANNGREVAKGRMNGNLFLTAYAIVFFFVLLMTVMLIFPSVSRSLTASLHYFLGYTSGKTMGKILALPFMAIIYFIVVKMVGTEPNYNRLVKEFYRLPEEEQALANKKLLIPFFILVSVFLVLALSFLV